MLNIDSWFFVTISCMSYFFWTPSTFFCNFTVQTYISKMFSYPAPKNKWQQMEQIETKVHFGGSKDEKHKTNFCKKCAS